MSDNLDNVTEAQEQVDQPTDVVATKVEEGATPTSTDSDLIEIEVEEQGDQQTTPEQSVDWRKAMQKEKAAKRRKTEQLNAEQEKNNRLQKEIDELKAQINPIVNPKPTLEKFDYDNDRYEKAVNEYYQNQSKQPSSKPQEVEQEQFNEQAFEADYYLRRKEGSIAKVYPKYEQDKSELLDKFTANGGNAETFTFLSNIASQAKIDIAKANIGLNGSDTLFKELLSAARGDNVFAVADVLKRAENKVKFSTKKSIDTKPEPTINSKRSQLVNNLDQFGSFE
ncbi:MAG: hypothetical protein Unbinned6284contig1001_36 [Prokaryotic dsDNA virus sp.]|nr:MAG: hypothetical protein Unbinned6284contig1001_36 [Prokaryotic dsDNA virus sp.]|tara:strand:+ start:13969 stop:14811 length:843 start_codon:yes stop_codon:yes gene_type:complete